MTIKQKIEKRIKEKQFESECLKYRLCPQCGEDIELHYSYNGYMPVPDTWYCTKCDWKL